MERELVDLSKQVKDVDKKIARLMSAIEQTDTPGPLLRRVGELETEREEILDRLDRTEQEIRQAKRYPR
jgi:chromosome segregation ATPase